MRAKIHSVGVWTSMWLESHCLCSESGELFQSEFVVSPPTLECVRIYTKTLTFFPVFLIALLFSAAGLAAWEEYPSLKMLMEMVMTKLVCLNPYTNQIDHWKHIFLNEVCASWLLPFQWDWCKISWLAATVPFE